MAVTALKDLSFAAETYDAVNLRPWRRRRPMTMPALRRGEPDRRIRRPRRARRAQPGRQARGMQDVQGLPGSPEGGNGVDYDGESGPVRFDANGDITTANYMVFTYGADNRAILTGSEAAGRAAG